MKKKLLCYLLMFVLILQSIPMNVEAAGVTKITNVSGKSLYMAVGSSFALKTNVSRKNVEYVSSKTTVATVSETGVITAVKKGTAYVTVTNTKTDKSKKLKVKVGKPKGYTFSRNSGTYTGSVTVNLKAKKGYKVYYSTNGKFVKKQVIQSGKSQAFTFNQTTELTVYVFKKSEKLTSAKKKQRKVMYTYTIEQTDSGSKEETTTETKENTATTVEQVTTVEQTTEQTVTTEAGKTESEVTTEENGNMPTEEAATEEIENTEENATTEDKTDSGENTTTEENKQPDEETTTEAVTTTEENQRPQRPGEETTTEGTTTEEEITTEEVTTEENQRPQRPGQETTTEGKTTEEKITTEEVTTEEVATEETTTEENQRPQRPGQEATTEGITTEGEITTEEVTTEEVATEEITTETVTTEEAATEETTTEETNTEEDATTEESTEVEEGVSHVIVATDDATATEIVIGTKPESKQEYFDAEGNLVVSITKKNKVTIHRGGTYRITGSEEEVTGRIEVEAYEEITNEDGTVEEIGQDVTIILSGVNMTSDDVDGVFTVKKVTNSATIVLEEGTVNYFKDTAEIETEEVTDDTTGETTTEITYPDGAVMSKKTSLTIEGSGKLVVSSTYGTGVKSSDSLTIDGATIEVVSAGNNGISGKTALNIIDSDITVTSDGDGIKTTTPDDETDTTLGNLTIENSVINITCYEDGIQSYRNATLTDCDVTITAAKDDNKLTTVEGETKDSFKGIKANGDIYIDGGEYVVESTDDAINADGAVTITDDAVMNLTSTVDDGVNAATILTISNSNLTVNAAGKGIVATEELIVSGGEFDIDSTDDSVHSNGTITISDSPVMNVFSTDDGVHAETDLVINSGTITVEQSYEALEGASVTINGGEMTLNSTDDGINSAGGSDGDNTSQDQFRPGQNQGGNTGSGSSYNIYINGGTIKVNLVGNSGDGIDANGTAYLKGGTLYVEVPVSGGDLAPLDSDSGVIISGGTLVTTSGASMMSDAQPSTSSTQCSMVLSLGSTQNAGTSITVKDSAGNEIINYTPNKQYSTVIVSSPDLVQGQTYTYTCGSTSSTITLSSVVTSTGSTSGPGGNMPW